MNAPTPRVPKPNPAQLAKAGKERKQLFVLGGLALAFVAVLVVQFGGSDGVGVSTPDDEPIVQADTAAGSAQVPAFPGGAAQDNDVFINTEDDASVKRSPFQAFWKLGDDEVVEADPEVPELPAPVVRLDGTITSGSNPKAFIDGQLRSLGDSIGGWTLVAVGSREITLRSPTKRTVTVEMPKVAGMN